MTAVPQGARVGQVERVSRVGRVAAIDVLRGFVMVLMSIDHASEKLNGGRFFADAVFMYKPGTPIDPAQFMTRWITHLCAPTFVALAGTALAMSTESRRARGEGDRSIDRHIAIRGVLLLLFEVLWMSWALLGEWGTVLFQVLYALGTSLLCMTLLRRLGDRVLLVVGLALAFGSELVVGLLAAANVVGTLPAALTFAGGFLFGGKLIIGYPTAEWLGMMCMGWAFGRRLLAWRAAGDDPNVRASRVLAVFGAAFLGVFLVLRGLNGFGNMMLLREGGSLVQWLHVSKYPASATYVGLELGIAALLLSALMSLGAKVPRLLAPLHLFGQTALFFYLIHAHLLWVAARILGHGRFGIASAYIGALAVLVALYPACLWYRRYKSAHPNGWAQWI